jgi:hypothetical protein
MKPTQAQRTRYREVLIERGLPEVYAWMAAKYLDSDYPARTLRSGFLWGATPEGFDFWEALCIELRDLK